MRLSPPPNFPDVIWLPVLISMSDVRYRVSQGGRGAPITSVPRVTSSVRRDSPGPGQDRPCEWRGGSRARAVRVIARLCRDEASKYRVRRWRDTPFSPASDFNQEKTMERWKCEVRKKSEWCVNIGPVSCENLVIMRAVTSEIFANLLSLKSQDCDVLVYCGLSGGSPCYHCVSQPNCSLLTIRTHRTNTNNNSHLRVFSLIRSHQRIVTIKCHPWQEVANDFS